MTTSTFEFTLEDNAAIVSASKQLKARYRNFVEYEDVLQELRLWLFANYDRALRWREEKIPAHAHGTLVKALRNVGERYCRSEKAEIEGYEPVDEYFYSIPQIADMLTLYFDADWPCMKAIDYEHSDQGGLNIAPASELVTMVADVGKHFERLARHDKDLLQEVYAEGVATDKISVLSLEWDCTYSAAYSRVSRVVGRLRALLGGPSPYFKGALDE